MLVQAGETHIENGILLLAKLHAICVYVCVICVRAICVYVCVILFRSAVFPTKAPGDVNHQGLICGQTDGILTIENFFGQSPHPHLYPLCQNPSISYPRRWRSLYFECQNCPWV